MIDWKKTLVLPTASIRETIENMNLSAVQISLVVDENEVLLGTVTDGDIRSGILKGLSLDDFINKVMNKQPTVAKPDDDPQWILNLMKQKRIHQLPIIDREGRVLGLETLDELIKPVQQDNIVVLMAGGLGTRLQPLTNDRPKPLLYLKSKPIMEVIIENIRNYGFKRFYISVNYKADMIKNYFGDGSRWDIEINYISEEKQLGTAGALGFLPEKPIIPLLIMNADLITQINFKNLLSYHSQQNVKATMCICEYDIQVPFGVVHLDQERFIGMEEKPIKRFFVNGGIYVLEPETLDYVPKNTYFNMPQLFEKLVKEKHPVSVYPIKEYWMDIGRMNDYIRANEEYED